MCAPLLQLLQDSRAGLGLFISGSLGPALPGVRGLSPVMYSTSTYSREQVGEGHSQGNGNRSIGWIKAQALFSEVLLFRLFPFSTRRVTSVLEMNEEDLSLHNGLWII